MNVFFSKNTDLLISTIFHPAVYPMMVDDTNPDLSQIQLDDDLFIAECHDKDRYFGCFLLEKKSDYHVDAHACLLPSAKGKARAFGKMMLNLIFTSTNYLIVSTLSPSHNRVAENVAKKIGFIYSGSGKVFTVKGNQVSSSLYVFHRGMSWA